MVVNTSKNLKHVLVLGQKERCHSSCKQTRCLTEKSAGLFFFNTLILGDPHAKKGSHQTKALQSSYGLEVYPLDFFCLKIIRQSDTNYYEYQNLCANHVFQIVSRCFQTDQQGSIYSFSSLFSCAELVLFPCSVRLKRTNLRRTLVFAFGAC